MAGDEHHPSPPKLLDHAEAVIEQHREANDYLCPFCDQRHDPDAQCAPYDRDAAAEHDLIEFCRKYRPPVLDVLLSDRQIIFRADAGYVAVYGPLLGERRLIRFDPPGDGH